MGYKQGGVPCARLINRPKEKVGPCSNKFISGEGPFCVFTCALLSPSPFSRVAPHFGPPFEDTP